MTELADQVPPGTAALSKAERLEQLRRKMASIPARSDGTEPATPSVMLRPVDEREPTPSWPRRNRLSGCSRCRGRSAIYSHAGDLHEEPSSASTAQHQSWSDYSPPSPLPEDTSP